MDHQTLRSPRDTFLGIAAIIFAVRYLLGALGVASSLDWSHLFAAPRFAAISVLLLLGSLVRAAGFVLVAVAFVADRSGHARRVSFGAWVIAGGYFAIFAALALSTVDIFSNAELPLSGRLAVQSIMNCPPSLAAAVGFVLVASAFAPKNRVATSGVANARNQRLGWASIGLGVGFGLSTLSDLVAGFEWSGFTADALLLVAAVVAATGFFKAARADQYPGTGPLARREGFLGIAAVALALSGAVAVLREMILPLGFTLSYGDWRSAALGWTNVLSSLCLMVAGLCAARGFQLSRRSLRSHD
jgi:hypothetical protein